MIDSSDAEAHPAPVIELDTALMTHTKFAVWKDRNEGLRSETEKNSVLNSKTQKILDWCLLECNDMKEHEISTSFRISVALGSFIPRILHFQKRESPRSDAVPCSECRWHCTSSPSGRIAISECFE
jgi:hypothetical protein